MLRAFARTWGDIWKQTRFEFIDYDGSCDVATDWTVSERTVAGHRAPTSLAPFRPGQAIAFTYGARRLKTNGAGRWGRDGAGVLRLAALADFLACGSARPPLMLRGFVSSASHQVGMAAVAATWPTSGVRVALLPARRASSANWAELITAAPPGSLLK